MRPLLRLIAVGASLVLVTVMVKRLVKACRVKLLRAWTSMTKLGFVSKSGTVFSRNIPRKVEKRLLSLSLPTREKSKERPLSSTALKLPTTVPDAVFSATVLLLSEMLVGPSLTASTWTRTVACRVLAALPSLTL